MGDLTEAQRRALLWLPADGAWRLVPPEVWLGNMPELIEMQIRPVVAFWYPHARLTNAGRELAAKLKVEGENA